MLRQELIQKTVSYLEALPAPKRRKKTGRRMTGTGKGTSGQAATNFNRSANHVDSFTHSWYKFS